MKRRTCKTCDYFTCECGPNGNCCFTGFPVDCYADNSACTAYKTSEPIAVKEARHD